MSGSSYGITVAAILAIFLDYFAKNVELSDGRCGKDCRRGGRLCHVDYEYGYLDYLPRYTRDTDRPFLL